MLHKEGIKMKRKKRFQKWIKQVIHKRNEEDTLIIEKQSNSKTKVIRPQTETEYEILEREILPVKIICPDCGGMTWDGLEYCHKCGGELNN